MTAQPYISLTAWITSPDLTEATGRGEMPKARIHLVIPHGKRTRRVVVEVGLEQCLALCANAADAARLLAPYRSTIL